MMFYYTLTLTDVRLDDLEDLKTALTRHGNDPGMHHAKPDDARQKDRCALTLTFTFDAEDEDDESSWQAYHSLVRCYAVAAASRYSARATTVIAGSIYDHAMSPGRLRLRFGSGSGGLVDRR
jgi:hypothetical protein